MLNKSKISLELQPEVFSTWFNCSATGCCRRTLCGKNAFKVKIDLRSTSWKIITCTGEGFTTTDCSFQNWVSTIWSKHNLNKTTRILMQCLHWHASFTLLSKLGIWESLQSSRIRSLSSACKIWEQNIFLT